MADTDGMELAIEVPAYQQDEDTLFRILAEGDVNYTTGAGRHPRYVFLRDSQGQQDGWGRTADGWAEYMRDHGNWTVLRIPYTDEQQPRHGLDAFDGR
jgi:hypothetical protein